MSERHVDLSHVNGVDVKHVGSVSGDPEVRGPGSDAVQVLRCYRTVVDGPRRLMPWPKKKGAIPLSIAFIADDRKPPDEMQLRTLPCFWPEGNVQHLAVERPASIGRWNAGR